MTSIIGEYAAIASTSIPFQAFATTQSAMARRSVGSVMTRAVAGRSAWALPRLRWNVRCGSASRFSSQARFRSARGVPVMISRPSMLWKTISMRRGSPVLRPVVVMSMR